MKKHKVTYIFSRERIVLHCVCGCALLYCDDRQKMSGMKLFRFVIAWCYTQYVTNSFKDSKEIAEFMVTG